MMRRVLLAALLALQVGVIGCGKGGDNAQPAPAPAPAPAPPVNTAPPAPPSIPGTNCPAVSGGTPMGNGQPFYGSLMQGGFGGYPGGYGGGYGGTNSMAISFSTLSQQNTWGAIQNVIGSGSVSIPSIMAGVPSMTAQNYNVCVSSMGYGGGNSVTPGTIDWSRGGQLNVTLRGQVQLPYYSPYGGGPSVMGPSYVEVTLGGYSCAAYLTQSNRISGCVLISIGGGQPQMFQSQ